MCSIRVADRAHAPGRAAWCALACAALVAVACDPVELARPPFEGAGSRRPHRGGVLRTFQELDLRSLDPAIGFDTISGIGQRHIHAGLVDYADETADIVPELAERWTVSPDGKTYTFTLRPNIRFHHGRAIRAEDFRWSLERIVNPRTQSPLASFFRLIEGFDDYVEGRAPTLRGISAPDDRTVVLRLREADPTIMHMLAMSNAAVIPREVVERWGQRFSDHVVGAGPFRITEWERGVRLRMRRFESYHAAREIWLDGIDLSLNLPRDAAFLRFRRGMLEHLDRYTPQDYIMLRRAPGWRDLVHRRPKMNTYGLLMNMEMPPFDNVHFRRAVAYAVNRDSIRRVRNDRIRVSGRLYPEGLPGWTPQFPEQTYDPARARRELAQAGYRNGYPDELEMTFLVSESSRQWAEICQSDLLAIGIKTRIRLVQFPTYLEQTGRPRTVRFGYTGWNMDYPDASNFTEPLFHSRAIQPRNSQNKAFFRNAELDALLDRARVELDPARRLAMYRRAEEIIVGEAAWAFHFHEYFTEVTAPYVRGYVQHPVEEMLFTRTWLDLPRRERVARARDDGERFGLAAAFLSPRAGWR